MLIFSKSITDGKQYKIDDHWTKTCQSRNGRQTSQERWIKVCNEELRLQSLSGTKINKAKWSFLGPFLPLLNQAVFFRGSWISIENWLAPKIEPPSGNLAWPNPWNALNNYWAIKLGGALLLFQNSSFERKY